MISAISTPPPRRAFRPGRPSRSGPWSLLLSADCPSRPASTPAARNSSSSSKSGEAGASAAAAAGESELRQPQLRRRRHGDRHRVVGQHLRPAQYRGRRAHPRGRAQGRDHCSRAAEGTGTNYANVFGTDLVNVINQANAYAAIAAQGRRPTLPDRQRQGHREFALNYKAKPSVKQVFDQNVMRDAIQAMSKVVQSGGTGAAGRARSAVLQPARPARPPTTTRRGSTALPRASSPRPSGSTKGDGP